MSKRPASLATDIRRIIAPVLRECPPACGIVTLTRLEVSSDFSYATAYVSALQAPEQALAFLEGRRARLQQSLCRIPRRRAPLLRFRLDDVAARAARIDELLKRDNMQRGDS